MMDDHETTKHLFDALSISAVLGALVGYLPDIAAGLSIIWTLLRLYESKTVQSLLFGKKD